MGVDLLASLRKPRASSAQVVPLAALALPLLSASSSPDRAYVIPRVRDLRSGEVISLDQVKARYMRAAFVGPSGFGKSSALAFLSEGAAVLSLADYHLRALPGDWKRSERILLDDAAPVHAEYLAGLDQEYPDARMYVAAENSSAVPAAFSTLGLEPFEEAELVAMARAWLPERVASAFVEQIGRDPRIRLLASRPLDLFLLIQVHAAGQTLPARRAELFDAYLRAYLNRERDPDFAARALEGIALSTKRGQLAKDEHLARGYGLLVKQLSGRITFAHAALHDFLAACALRHNPDLAPLLEHAAEENWKQVVLFYAGLSPDETVARLVAALRERGRTELAAEILEKERLGA